MKNIIIFDTSIGTMNHGDEIIMESFLRNANDLLQGNNAFRFPTHTPCFLPYQQSMRNSRYRFVANADYKFICGTNLLNNKMHHLLWPFFNVNLFNSKCYQNSVLVGVGVSGFHSDNKVSAYTKALFSKILSKNYIHSVRDDRSVKIVESICGKGSAINTGCPTLWGLTDDFCAEIPTEKADRVVFTLTDYSKNPTADQNLIDILNKNYSQVYFWPQGSEDFAYIQTFQNIENIQILSPSVRAYSELLSSGNIDYIGTRLHAGIFAMQHKVRGIILSVDNRAKDMAEVYNLNVIERNAEHLEELLNSHIETQIHINVAGIQQWKAQFLEK